MPEVAYEIVKIAGLRQSTHRSIVFLQQAGNDQIDGLSVFQGLPKKREREVRSRFDHWIDGNTYKQYFHGWDTDAHKDCFVFKWKEKNVHQRLYGFLCHPRKAEPSFLVCVLCNHATKNKWETDLSELDGASKLFKNPKVHAAIALAYPAPKERARQ